MAATNGIADGFLDEYEHLRCRRVPEFDRWYRGKDIVETNDDLPDGAPGFYCEE